MVQQDTKKKKGSMSNSENKHVLENRSAKLRQEWVDAN